MIYQSKKEFQAEVVAIRWVNELALQR